MKLQDSSNTRELEIQSMLFIRLKDKGATVRLEQDIPGAKQRVDIAIFDDEGNLSGVIEVKKDSSHYILGEACNQCHRYRGTTGVAVYLVAGMQEAELFVKEWPRVGRFWYVHRQPSGRLGKRI
jgi:hypothetical protein